MIAKVRFSNILVFTKIYQYYKIQHSQCKMETNCSKLQNTFYRISLIFCSCVPGYCAGCSDQSEWELLSEATYPEIASEGRVSEKNMLREERERRAEEVVYRAGREEGGGGEADGRAREEEGYSS